MSRVNQVVCDHCQKVQEDTWDNAMSEWRDPDRWDGWWSLDMSGMDGREHYDLCCLECLREWVKGRGEWWEQYIEKDAVTYDKDVTEKDSSFIVLIGNDCDVRVHRCRFCSDDGSIHDVQMSCGVESSEALSDGQKAMWDGLDDAGKQGLLFKLMSQGMDVVAGLLADYAGGVPDGFVWMGRDLKGGKGEKV